jgi:hypothetical protein
MRFLVLVVQIVLIDIHAVRICMYIPALPVSSRKLHIYE